MTNAECLFCRQLANREQLPDENIVWQFPHSVAILSDWQFYHGYCILIARRHATELSQLTETERHAYLDEMCLLARAIEECSRPAKLNYELLGNQVPHLHWHIIPRSADDPDRLQPVWFALERAKQDSVEQGKLRAGKMERAGTRAMLRRKLEELMGETQDPEVALLIPNQRGLNLP